MSILKEHIGEILNKQGTVNRVISHLPEIGNKKSLELSIQYLTQDRQEDHEVWLKALNLVLLGGNLAYVFLILFPFCLG